MASRIDKFQIVIDGGTRSGRGMWTEGKIKIPKGDLYGGFRGKVSNLTSHHNKGHERGLIGDGELDEEGGKGRFKGKGTGGKLVKTGGREGEATNPGELFG